MSWWQQIFSPKTSQHWATTSNRGGVDGSATESEIELRQPFSDGSEEFFGEFVPRDERRWHPQKQVMIGLGITAGVLAGVGIAVWLKRTKRRKSLWQRLSGK
jgi:hypothetical protein